jgi:hypothetical protein
MQRVTISLFLPLLRELCLNRWQISVLKTSQEAMQVVICAQWYPSGTIVTDDSEVLMNVCNIRRLTLGFKKLIEIEMFLEVAYDLLE